VRHAHGRHRTPEVATLYDVTVQALTEAGFDAEAIDITGARTGPSDPSPIELVAGVIETVAGYIARRPHAEHVDPAAPLAKKLVALTMLCALWAGLGGTVQFQAAPPMLVSSSVNAAHVGLTVDELREHLEWVARDPRWHRTVIELSPKWYLATPADVVASLLDRYGASEAEGVPARRRPS
jgi:hypothetical protein